MLSILFICFNHYHNSKTLGFFYFVGLKIHKKPLVYAAQCRVPGWTLQNKSGLSKVTPLTKGTWLCTKNCPDNTCGKSSHFLSLVPFSIFLSPLPCCPSLLFITHFLLQLSCPLTGFWGDTCPISTIPCYFLIMKEDFGGVLPV